MAAPHSLKTTRLAGPSQRSAGPFFATAEQRTDLAREMFFGEGQRPSGLVPEWVIQSWMRCTVAHRQPDEPLQLEPVTRSRVSQALARNRLLLQAAKQDLHQLDSALAGTSCKALLTGPDGILIQATPTASGAGRLMPAVTRLGVNLNETHMGTTAPSVVVRTGEACVVRGAEHFFTGISLMQCAAAPILNARGDLAGVLDLSSDGAPFRFDAAAMVHLYATSIENRLFEAQSAGLLLLRFQSSPALLHTPLEGLAAVDGQGRLAWLNQTGARLLGTGRVPERETDVEQLFGVGLEHLLAMSHRHEPQPKQLPNGLTLWIQAQTGSQQCPPPDTQAAAWEPAETTQSLAETSAAPVASTLDNANRALIENTLAEFQGNVSRAARQLGVSRGLLYRRLAEWRLGGAPAH